MSINSMGKQSKKAIDPVKAYIKRFFKTVAKFSSIGFILGNLLSGT
jgi:ElaB/YqjD/DUF883 family membrane-anchored ribosome-binding protein